jgi:hypothetical protein
MLDEVVFYVGGAYGNINRIFAHPGLYGSKWANRYIAEHPGKLEREVYVYCRDKQTTQMMEIAVWKSFVSLGQPVQRECPWDGIAGRKAHAAMGYPGLIKGRQTHAERGFPGLITGRAIYAAKGFPGLDKLGELGRAKLAETGQSGVASRFAQAARGYPSLQRGRATNSARGHKDLIESGKATRRKVVKGPKVGLLLRNKRHIHYQC